MKKTLVVIPTFNEIASVQGVVERIKSSVANVDILIVDDNSPDGTGQLADGLSNEHIFVLHRKKKEGLGPAYLAGFHWGIDRGYERFVEMDGDGSHQPEELPGLLAPSLDHDLVLGTRWMEGGSVINWPLSRRLLSRFGTKYASVALALPFRDLTSGYRVLSRTLIEDIFHAQLSTIGYGFQIEIVRIAQSHNRSIVEIPITFIERSAGSSKMSNRIIFEAWFKTTSWGLRRIVNRR